MIGGRCAIPRRRVRGSRRGSSLLMLRIGLRAVLGLLRRALPVVILRLPLLCVCLFVCLFAWVACFV